MFSHFIKTKNLTIKFLVSIAVLISLSTFVTCDKKPVFIAEVWRHGARSAKKNKIAPDDYKKFGEENLTPNGMRMHFALGQEIRARYQDTLFNTPFTWNTSIVYTSDTQRNFLSAYSHMAGLFPLGTGPDITTTANQTLVSPGMPTPHFKSNGNSAISGKIQPVHIQTKAIESDIFFGKGFDTLCPTMMNKATLIYDQLVAEVQSKIQPTCDKLSKIFDSNIYFKGKTMDLKILSKIADTSEAYLYQHGTLIPGVDYHTHDMLILSRGI